MAAKLNAQQNRYALNIAQGMNQTDAYVVAGYKARGPAAEQAASRLSRNIKVLGRIKELAAEVEDKSIATARERQQFWTSALRDSELEMKDRLKASELLGKAHGDFIERRDITSGGEPLLGFDIVMQDDADE